MKGDEDLKTNNKKFTQKLEDYKYILLDYSLYINELKNNKQKEIEISSFENMLNSFIRCVQDTEMETMTLVRNNEILNQRIDELLIKFNKEN
jgi:hypothetical protein